MGLRRSSTETRRRFKNISLPCVILHSAVKNREHGDRSVNVFSGGRVEAARPQKHRSCKRCSLGKFDDYQWVVGNWLRRWFDSQWNRRPHDLTGIPNEVAIYSQRDLFPVPHMGNCTAGAPRLLEHLSRHFILIFDHFSKKKRKKRKQG